jgi:putative N-acetylmannosamine-6-phosphate epimerase
MWLGESCRSPAHTNETQIAEIQEVAPSGITIISIDAPARMQLRLQEKVSSMLKLLENWDKILPH